MQSTRSTGAAARLMTAALFAIILLTGATGCETLVAPISPGRLDPAAICGPLPAPVIGAKKERLLALDEWLTAMVRERRPEDMLLLEELYLADPQQRREQIRTCHQTLRRDPTG